MSETIIPATEAARDFLRVLNWVENEQACAVIERDGRPVATLSPLPSPAITCAALAARWSDLERLSAEEASAFADDLEHGRDCLPPAKLAWD